MHVLTKRIASLLPSVFIRRISKIHRELAAEKKHIRLTWYLKVNKIINALESADHPAVQRYAADLVLNGCATGFFYKAQSLSLQNKTNAAFEALDQLLKNIPFHPDGTYLLAELLAKKGFKEQSWEKLETLLQYSKRRKTWQALSNLVDTPEDFDRFYSLFQKKYPGQFSTLPFDLSCHLSNAAIRGERKDFALMIWREKFHGSNQGKTVKSNKLPEKRYNDELAAVALKSAKQVFSQSNITFFLISGTLLGAIREGKLLSHDKDIDLGVWDNYSINQLKEIFYNSGCFYVLSGNSNHLLVVRHVNGVTIDIFIHYRTETDYWHAGGKSIWHNTPFCLTSLHFLAEDYFIPKNYELYLTENYGNWRNPMTEFDSALDTPNMEISDKIDMAIYLYKKLASPKKLSNKMYQRLTTALSLLGESITKEKDESN